MPKMNKYISTHTANIFVNDVNTLLGDVKKRIDFTPLGPDYAITDDTDTVEKWLQCYRLHKKFTEPTASVNLDIKSVQSMLAYDRCGLEKFEPVHIAMSPSARKLLYNLRLKLHENFSNFRLDCGRLVLPTGESDLGTQGDCSIFRKLADKKQWRVTPDCFELAASIIYNTTWLKRIARSHMPVYSREDNLRLYWGCNNQGFESFKCKLLDFVTLVDGSRISTVPKNNDERRVINMEPLLNMITQLTISGNIRNVFRSKYHFDIEDAQGVHGNMISNLNCATIDLSKASDSNWLSVINWLYPRRFSKFLNNARSPVGRFRGETHQFKMLSPMGNGFTFEVMTATLLTLARELDPLASVFGDDIIIAKEHAPLYLEVLSILGYKTNEKKTFVDGLFRESCGKFFHKDRYLTSYDFWYCEDIIDAIVSVNKLIRVGHLLGVERQELCRFLKTKVPLVLQKSGPWLLSDGFISIPEELYNVKRLKRKCASWTRSIPKFKHIMSSDITSFTYDHRLVDFYVNLNKESLTYITSGKWKNLPRDNVKSRALIGSYLYSGMCSAPTIRNKTRIMGELVVY